MRRLLLIAALLFSLFLVLPLVHLAMGWPPDYPLAGVESRVAVPEWTPAAWWNGTLQATFDTWINQRIGLRGLLVRTANQIQYTLFRELPQRSGTRVLLGRDGFLFEKAYLDAYNRAGRHSYRELRNICYSVRLMQDRLAADGIAFLLVIAPSKAEIYPEHLPPGMDVAGRPTRRSDYENLMPLLHAAGVNVVDGPTLFRQWKAEPGAPLLFGKGGTHWNQYGAARMVAEILARLRDLTGKDLPVLQVTGAVTNRTIIDADNDLGELLNLWSGRPFAGPQIQPVLNKQPGTHAPDILFIGDSFVFTLTNLMDREGLYRRRNTYYYYNRQYFYPEAPNEILDKRSLDLLQVLADRDAVVIEVSEYWLPRIGFGFVRDLLKAYRRLERARAAAAGA